MEYLTIADLRKLAIHTQLAYASKPTAAQVFTNKLKQLISRAPKIRFPYGSL